MVYLVNKIASMFNRFFFLFFLNVVACAQNFNLSVISSQGGYIKNTTYDISWTLGEVNIETFYNLNKPIFFTQGFEQPVFKTISEDTNTLFPTIFPNPTNGKLTFKLPNADSYQITGYDVLGQIVFIDDFFGTIYTANISSFSNAPYIFKLKTTDGIYKYNQKILKTD